MIRHAILTFFFAVMLLGCSEAEQINQVTKTAIEAGEVKNWRNPRLELLERALLLCDQPDNAMRYAASCASRQNEIEVLAEAVQDCKGLGLPMCVKARALIAAGPTRLSQRVVLHAAELERVEFDWYQEPDNRLLSTLFSLDDRLALCFGTIRRQSVFIAMFLIVCFAVWRMVKSYRSQIRAHEIQLAQLKLEHAGLHRSEQAHAAELARIKLLERQFDLVIAKKAKAYQEYLEQRECEKKRIAERERFAIERERALECLGRSIVPPQDRGSEESK
jgi:hypothetical protein